MGGGGVVSNFLYFLQRGCHGFLFGRGSTSVGEFGLYRIMPAHPLALIMNVALPAYDLVCCVTFSMSLLSPSWANELQLYSGIKAGYPTDCYIPRFILYLQSSEIIFYDGGNVILH